MAIADLAAPKLRRRWYQFSLRTLFIVLLASTGAFGDEPPVQEIGIEAIRTAGAEVREVPGVLNSPDTFLVKWQNADSKNIALLKVLPRLGTLNCGQRIPCGSLDDKSIIWLVDHFSMLEHLDLKGHQQISDPSLVALGKLHDLMELNLAETSVSDKGLGDLASLHKLEYLNLDLTKATSEGFTRIAAIGSLKHLDFCGNRLVRRDVNALQGLKMLEELNLDACPGVDDSVLSDLGRLHSLRKLSVWHCNDVTDAGLHELRDLSRLEWLSVAGTKITDTSIEDIIQHKTLRMLDLNNTRISAEGLQRINKELPQCNTQGF